MTSRPFISSLANTIRGCCLLFFIACLFCLHAADSSAFSLSEKFSFSLTWMGIKAGDAVLETKEKGDTVQFLSHAVSTEWVSSFYRVEDTIVSTLLKSADREDFPGLPSTYRVKISEGKNKKDREIVFNQASKKVTHIDHRAKEKEDFDITRLTFDPLSAFFFVRTLPLEVGKPVHVDIFDNKKLYTAEVQVLRKETLETPLGSFKTIVIKPVLKSDGIFYRKGDIYIWLTDDEKRIPVQLKTKVMLGSINAVLTGGRY